MTTDELRGRIEASVEGSLVQLGRGSGITPEQRANMAKIIAAPILTIVEDAVWEAQS